MLQGLKRFGSNIKTMFTGVVANSDLFDDGSWRPVGVSGVGGKSVVANPDSSYALAAYWACLKVISEDVAKLPIKILEKRDNGEFSANPNLQNILAVQPNPNMTAFSFWQSAMQYALGWGNFYAEIQVDGMGRPFALNTIHPARVTKMLDENRGIFFYRVQNNKGEPTDLKENEVLYIPGLTIDGITGISAAQVGKQSLTLGLESQNFATNFFKNSAAISGILSTPGKLDPKSLEALRSSWKKIYSGSGKAGETAILEQGMEFKPITMPLKDAQFLESRNFQIEEVARWFRMPPHKIQHLLRSTFTNIEVQGREYVDDTLMPWLVKIEQEVRIKLISKPNEFIKFNVNALLRGDTATRGGFYNTLFNLGSINSNEIRSFEGMNPYEGGDRFYIQGNLAEVRADGLLMISSSENTGKDDPEEETVIDAPIQEDSEGSANIDFMKPLVMERISTLVTREVKTFEAAHKKLDQDAFNNKADEFYKTYKTHLHNDLVKSADAITTITGASFSIKSFCTKSAETSKQLILNAYGDDDAMSALLDEWSKAKASNLADQFIDLSQVKIDFEQQPLVGEYGKDEDDNLVQFTDKLEWERVEK